MQRIFVFGSKENDAIFYCFTVFDDVSHPTQSHAEQTAKWSIFAVLSCGGIDHWRHISAARVYTTKPSDYSAQQYYFGGLDLADRWLAFRWSGRYCRRVGRRFW